METMLPQIMEVMCSKWQMFMGQVLWLKWSNPFWKLISSNRFKVQAMTIHTNLNGWNIRWMGFDVAGAREGQWNLKEIGGKLKAMRGSVLSGWVMNHSFLSICQQLDTISTYNLQGSASTSNLQSILENKRKITFNVREVRLEIILELQGLIKNYLVTTHQCIF